VTLGFALAAAGKADQGIALMEEGIKKGGLTQAEDAKLHLGIAQLQSGKKPAAIKTLKSVGGKDGTAELARYWVIFANQK
jgi:hypothetical protein